MVAITLVWHNVLRAGGCTVRVGAWITNCPPDAIIHTGRAESPDTHLRGL